MSSCTSEENAKNAAYQAYAAAMDNHIAEMNRVPRDDAAVIATGLALGPLWQAYLAAYGVWYQCVNNSGSGTP